MHVRTCARRETRGPESFQVRTVLKLQDYEIYAPPSAAPTQVSLELIILTVTRIHVSARYIRVTFDIVEYFTGLSRLLRLVQGILPVSARHRVLRDE